MNHSLSTLPLFNLTFAFIPVFIVIAILYHWSQGHKHALYGVSRMLTQLLIIGYFLAYLFESDSAWLVLAVLSIMVFASAWIALGSIPEKQRFLYSKALIALLTGGGINLILITQIVLALDPWYKPSYFIPLAGMIFANSMNSVSLGAERLVAEHGRGISYDEARNIAFRSSLIPITNSLFAVGLVAIPGMMTGQILSGVSPFIAARYQIMVMCMVFGSAGISSALFLRLVKPCFEEREL